MLVLTKTARVTVDVPATLSPDPCKVTVVCEPFSAAKQREFQDRIDAESSAMQAAVKAAESEIKAENPDADSELIAELLNAKKQELSISTVRALNALQNEALTAQIVGVEGVQDDAGKPMDSGLAAKAMIDHPVWHAMLLQALGEVGKVAEKNSLTSLRRRRN
jgi:hypothetical protein